MKNRNIYLNSGYSILALIIFMIFAGGSSDDRTPEQKAEADCSDTTLAFVMSQTFVKRKLKAPSTADFSYASSDGVSITYLGDCKHRINAYVDAQNGFGAMIRMQYRAMVQNDKGTDNWRLLNLEMK